LAIDDGLETKIENRNSKIASRQPNFELRFSIFQFRFSSFGFRVSLFARQSTMRRGVMSVLRNLASGLRALFHKNQAEQEMDEELRGYLDNAVKEKMRAGMNQEEELRAARVEMGSMDAVKEEIRSAGWEASVEMAWQDVRYGLRQLKRNPGFTAVAVLTLALGIGATTAIFTVVNAVLLRPLPYPHSEELVYVKENLGPAVGIIPFESSRDLAVWRNQSRTLSPVAAYITSSANLTGGREAERVDCGVASPSFFSLLDVHPAVGRVFLPGEDRPGAPPVAILSHALWKRDFRGDPSVVGRGVTLDGTTYTVVGVLPTRFVVPDLFRLNYDLWLPLTMSDSGSAQYPVVRVIGRLKPGVSLEQARAELDSIARSTVRKGPKKSVAVSAWHEEITSKARLSLLLFLGAVGLLLLIACVNVANLLLARSTTRQKEMAVRLAVGAGRARIVQQLVTESTLLALLGALLGLALARWGKDLMVAFISPNLPALEPIGLDYRVLGFSLALAIVTGLAFGLAPALQASRVSLNETLKESSRGATELRSRFGLRNLLIICETALAMVLLVGAGLLVKSFLRVRGIDMGFKFEHTLSMDIDLTPSKYPTPRDQSRFFQQVMEKIKGLGGVQSVGGSSGAPLMGYMSSISDLTLQGRQDTIPTATSYSMVSPDYFRTMGIPLMQGRNFSDADREGSPSVVIVNDSFARRYLPGENCLGKKIESWIQKNDWLTIVGVVGDVRSWAESEPTPELYLPYLQVGSPHMTLLVRTAGSPMYWAAAMRNQVATVDKDQPPHDLTALDELQTASLTSRRVNTLLFGAFALLGLTLASVGIYGVVSYSVTHRTHEIGVRMALGAGQAAVFKLVVVQGLSLALIGIAIGLAASFGVTRFLQAMLFGVKPADPATFLVAALLWIAIVALACYVPARRAMKVDPMVALRYE
jgi:putative ABC transport system permease protein